MRSVSAILTGITLAIAACLSSTAAMAQQVLRVAHAYKPETSVYLSWDELAKLVLEHEVHVEAYARGMWDERLAETRGRKEPCEVTRHGQAVWTKN